jgi:chromosome segregation ATPase
LSFSAIEDCLLGFEDITATDDDSTAKPTRPLAALIQQEAIKSFSYRKARRILFLEQASVPFVESAVNTVENLDQMAQQHVEQLNELYYQRLEEYQSLRATSTEVIGEEKSALTEGLRKVEVLGQKVDYEVNALQSRIQEVEDALNEFDRNVTDIEARVRELVDEDTGRTSWLYHLLTFFGT